MTLQRIGRAVNRVEEEQKYGRLAPTIYPDWRKTDDDEYKIAYVEITSGSFILNNGLKWQLAVIKEFRPYQTTPALWRDYQQQDVFVYVADLSGASYNAGDRYWAVRQAFDDSLVQTLSGLRLYVKLQAPVNTDPCGGNQVLGLTTPYSTLNTGVSGINVVTTLVNGGVTIIPSGVYKLNMKGELSVQSLAGLTLWWWLGPGGSAGSPPYRQNLCVNATTVGPVFSNMVFNHIFKYTTGTNITFDFGYTNAGGTFGAGTGFMSYVWSLEKLCDISLLGVNLNLGA